MESQFLLLNKFIRASRERDSLDVMTSGVMQMYESKSMLQ